MGLQGIPEPPWCWPDTGTSRDDEIRRRFGNVTLGGTPWQMMPGYQLTCILNTTTI